MDRNAILSALISDYSTYSTNTSGVDAEKVLKFSGRSFDIRERSDIRTEVVVFKYENAIAEVEVDDDKPTEMTQNFQALVYVQQADHHSAKETRYNRMLDLTDDLVNWSLQVVPSDIDTKVWTVTFTSASAVEEDDGYLSCEMNFKSIINLQ